MIRHLRHSHHVLLALFTNPRLRQPNFAGNLLLLLFYHPSPLTPFNDIALTIRSNALCHLLATISLFIDASFCTDKYDNLHGAMEYTSRKNEVKRIYVWNNKISKMTVQTFSQNKVKANDVLYL